MVVVFFGYASIRGRFSFVDLHGRSIGDTPKNNSFYCRRALIGGSGLLATGEWIRPSASGKTSLSMQQKNEFIIQIDNLITEKESINQTFAEKKDKTLIEGQYIAWANKTYEYLNANLGAPFAIQFKNAHAKPWLGSPAGLSGDGVGYWQEIQGKNQALKDFINELRRN